MEQLYILELTCGKWLVGKTKDMDHTYTYYEIGFGTQWVRTYAPLRIAEVRALRSPTDVRDTTLALMKTHGINAVRWHDFDDGMRISDEEEQAIRFLLHAPPDSCVKCHAAGHMSDTCTQPQNTAWACQWCVSDYPNRYACEQHERGCRPAKPEMPHPKNWCLRCGRKGHVAARCYETKHTEGRWLKTDS